MLWAPPDNFWTFFGYFFDYFSTFCRHSPRIPGCPTIFCYSGARGPPQFFKKRSENAGANENLSGGFAAIPGIAPRVAPRIVGFVLIKLWEAIPRMEFRIPRMEFPIPRAAPRIPRNSPRAPRMAFSLRERFSWNWGGPQASELQSLSFVSKWLRTDFLRDFSVKKFHLLVTFRLTLNSSGSQPHWLRVVFITFRLSINPCVVDTVKLIETD